MARYIITRLLLLVPVVILVSMLVFTLIRIVPGDVVDLMLENLASGGALGAEQTTRAHLRAELGLDKPIPVQYLDYVGQLAHGDMGRSVWSGRPVLGEIWKAVPPSAELILLSVVIALAVALPLGTVSATRQDSWVDYVARVVSILGLSMPSFWIGTILVVFMALWWNYSVPLTFMFPWSDPWANLQHVIFPAVVLGFILTGSLARMVRSSLLEVLRQDYIRTARAKGVAQRNVVVRHAMKNAFIPVITILGLQLGTLLGGTVIVETIFNLPGLGSLVITAIQRRDYPMLQGLVLIFAVILVLLNLVIDLLYSWFDPRIKYA